MDILHDSLVLVAQLGIQVSELSILLSQLDHLLTILAVVLLCDHVFIVEQLHALHVSLLQCLVFGFDVNDGLFIVHILIQIFVALRRPTMLKVLVLRLGGLALGVHLAQVEKLIVLCLHFVITGDLLILTQFTDLDFAFSKQLVCDLEVFLQFLDLLFSAEIAFWRVGRYAFELLNG